MQHNHLETPVDCVGNAHVLIEPDVPRGSHNCPVKAFLAFFAGLE
jgi:hypothetical protein